MYDYTFASLPALTLLIPPPAPPPRARIKRAEPDVVQRPPRSRLCRGSCSTARVTADCLQSPLLYIDFLLFCLLDARGTMQTPVSPSQQATKNRRRPGPQPCTPGVLQARLSMPRSAASMVVHYWEAAATAEALAAARHRDTNETGTIKGRKGTNGCIQTSSRPLPAP